MGNSLDSVASPHLISVASSQLISNDELVLALRDMQSDATPSWRHVLLELSRRSVVAETNVHKAIVRATWCLVGATVVLAAFSAIQTVVLLLGR
jgi:hypothetical protein